MLKTPNSWPVLSSVAVKTASRPRLTVPVSRKSSRLSSTLVLNVATSRKLPVTDRAAESGVAATKSTAARTETLLRVAVIRAVPTSRGLMRPTPARLSVLARTSRVRTLGEPREPAVVEKVTVRSVGMTSEAIRTTTFVTVAPSAGASVEPRSMLRTSEAGTPSKGTSRLRVTLTVSPSRISAVTTAVPAVVELLRVAVARPVLSAGTTRVTSRAELPPTKLPRVVAKLSVAEALGGAGIELGHDGGGGEAVGGEGPRGHGQEEHRIGVDRVVEVGTGPRRAGGGARPRGGKGRRHASGRFAHCPIDRKRTHHIHVER